MTLHMYRVKISVQGRIFNLIFKGVGENSKVLIQITCKKFIFIKMTITFEPFLLHAFL